MAGDLLENATPQQQLATAFHRQTLTNTEGGTDQEEFRCEAIFDRVETLGTVWLGLTIGCARCHSHKYDPISQREYYKLFAFFNNGDEVNMDIPSSPDAQAKYDVEHAQWKHALDDLEKPLTEAREGLRDEFTAWEQAQRARVLEATKSKVQYQALQDEQAISEAAATLTQLDDGSYLASGTKPKQDVYRLSGKLPVREQSESAPPVTGFRLEVLTDKSLPKNGPGWADNGNFVLSEFTVDLITPDGDASRRVKFTKAIADFSQNGFEVAKAIDGVEDTYGWAISSEMGKPHTAQFLLSEGDIKAIDETSGAGLLVRLSQQYDKPGGFPHPIGRFRLTAIVGHPPESLGLPDDIQKILAVAPEKRDDKQNSALFDHFAKQDPDVKKLQAAVDAHKKTEPFNPKMTVRVVKERTNDRRETHVFKRGSFLDPLDPVQPGTFEILHALPENAAGNRLELAKWLASPENPLTPRVTVNQMWAHLFGEGLVRTANDFGVRGERPTHPRLLDWLAVEFLRLGWSRKALIKRIVLSETYRQSSVQRIELLEHDPENRLLARQNRFRVEGEIVRDLFLSASGLLEQRIGGPSVFPPLPEGVAALSYANNFRWGNSDWNGRPDKPHGVSPKDDIYRRGMYTFFKRTAAHPNLMTFDCPDSNTTCVERSTSNTPLQALVTLNNAVFLNAARSLTLRVLKESPSDDVAQLEHMVRLCLVRHPSSDETRELNSLLDDARGYYQAHAEEAKTFAGNNNPQGLDPAELAAWVTVARVILNLDEFVTRE